MATWSALVSVKCNGSLNATDWQAIKGWAAGGSAISSSTPDGNGCVTESPVVSVNRSNSKRQKIDLSSGTA